MSDEPSYKFYSGYERLTVERDLKPVVVGELPEPLAELDERWVWWEGLRAAADYMGVHKRHLGLEPVEAPERPNEPEWNWTKVYVDQTGFKSEEVKPRMNEPEQNG